MPRALYSAMVHSALTVIYKVVTLLLHFTAEETGTQVMAAITLQ